MSIRIVKCSTGERLVLLVDGRYGMPDTWVAGYSITRLRHLKTRSIRNSLEGIAKGLAFFRSRGASDFRERVVAELPTSDDLTSLAHFLMSPPGNAKSNIATRASAHYSRFTDYVTWLHEQLTRDRGGADSAKLRLEFRDRAARCKPRSQGERVQGPRLGFTETQRALFERIIVPGVVRPLNAMSVRDYVLLSMSFDLGLRSGELLGIRIPHLELTGRQCYLEVRRTPDDPDDSRRLAPGQKTLERVLPLSGTLARACDAWLEMRDENPAARRHDYFFVNSDGAPLGYGGLRRIFERLCAEFPELGDLFNHRLRHDWNDRFSEMIAEAGWDRVRGEERRNEAMGWKPGSEMSSKVYGERWRRRKVDECLLAMQRRSRGTGQ